MTKAQPPDGCRLLQDLFINALKRYLATIKGSELISDFTRMLKVPPLWWEDSALSYPTSRAAVTPAHASYPPHSSSAVVFGAAETCRNIRDPAAPCGPSGAWRKGCAPPAPGRGACINQTVLSAVSLAPSTLAYLSQRHRWHSRAPRMRENTVAPESHTCNSFDCYLLLPKAASEPCSAQHKLEYLNSAASSPR